MWSKSRSVTLVEFTNCCQFLHSHVTQQTLLRHSSWAGIMLSDFQFCATDIFAAENILLIRKDPFLVIDLSKCRHRKCVLVKLMF